MLPHQGGVEHQAGHHAGHHAAHHSGVNPLDELAISNTLARYCEALDTKLFSLLDKVFIPDVVADYPFNNDLKGLDALRGAIVNRLGPIQTHHSLTTRTLVFPSSSSSSGTKTANAVTHFTGSHFGQGPHAGKVLTAYGRYIDELVCLPPSSAAAGGGIQHAHGAPAGGGAAASGGVEGRGAAGAGVPGAAYAGAGQDYEGVEGASGVWRIAKRTVVFTARVGDERIMQEF